MKPRTIAAAALAWTMAATAAAAQECEADASDCFNLWTGCAAIHPFVFVDENEIGLQRADIVNAAESRLRAARIFAPSEAEIASTGGFYIYVDFAGSAVFGVSFNFFKPGLLRDEHGFQGIADTWPRYNFGTHTGNSAFVMEQVRRYLDGFLNDYLRVNGPACEGGER